jgi:hypothetical protein
MSTSDAGGRRTRASRGLIPGHDSSSSQAISRSEHPGSTLIKVVCPTVCDTTAATPKGVKRSDMDDEAAMNTVETLETMTLHLLLVNQ